MHIMWNWDEDKRLAYIAKHRIDFAMIAQLDWTEAEIEPGNRSDYGEDRIVATGMIGDRLHVAIHTERDGTKRIISLRKANNREFDRLTCRAERSLSRSGPHRKRMPRSIAASHRTPIIRS